MQAHCVEEPEISPDYEDTSLPGVKVHLTFPERGARQKPARSSMRKLPKKASSMREKKNKDTDKKNARRKSNSQEEEKQVLLVTAGHSAELLEVKSVPVAEPEGETAGCQVTREERPSMTSLNSSELMLVSADKGDLGTMVSIFEGEGLTANQGIRE